MSPSYTVTSKTGYGSRIWNSIKAIGWGFLLIIWAIILLWWNENNFVEQKAALEETEWVTVETSADKIDASLDKSAIYINWKTSSPDESPLIDETFWVKTDDLKLIRRVEMYQWEEEEQTETEDNLGWSQTTTTTYTYNKVWSENHIDSSRFYKAGYENPSWKYEKESYEKDPILLWAYTLSRHFVDMLTDELPVNLADQEITSITWMQVLDSLLYVGNNPQEPEIWDLKITFYRVPAWNASAVGQQFADTLKPYTTSNHRSIGLLEQDNVTVHELFEHAHSANQMMTWILRGIGFLLLWMWFSMIFSILETLAKVVPFIANIIWAATGIVTFCLALIVWLLTVAIAWLVVRPIYGICALIAVIWIIVWLVYMGKKSPKKESVKEDSHPVKDEPKDDLEPEIIEA